MTAKYSHRVQQSHSNGSPSSARPTTKLKYSRTSQIATPKGLASAVAISEVSQLQKFRFFSFFLLICCFLAIFLLIWLSCALKLVGSAHYSGLLLQWKCSG